MPLVLRLHGNSDLQSFLVLNSTTMTQMIRIATVSTIAIALIHLIVDVFHIGIVLHGQIRRVKENSIGNSKQSYGILMVPYPKLVKPIQRSVFICRFEVKFGLGPKREGDRNARAQLEFNNYWGKIRVRVD